MIANFTLRTYDINKVVSEKKNGFDDSFVTNCLQQIEMYDLLHVRIVINEQPSDIKTIFVTFYQALTKNVLKKQSFDLFNLLLSIIEINIPCSTESNI